MEPDVLVRLALALVCGGAIGAERRFRGHDAGPHTVALVAMGAALFMVLARDLGGDATARIAAQVTTGIGFLAGGVIMRDGQQIRGLNTAATVWCAAAIGCLAGGGGIVLTLGAAALVVVANSIFHLLEHRMPALRKSEDQHQAGTGADRHDHSIR